MAENTGEVVFELIDSVVLDALEDGVATVAVHGLKNELNRLHNLLERAARVDQESVETIWTRIVVIQEALLDVARMIVKNRRD
jgi:hypothetical protein